MLDILDSILGLPPAGMEFLRYVFGVMFVMVGVYFLYRIVSAFFSSFIR